MAVLFKKSVDFGFVWNCYIGSKHVAVVHMSKIYKVVLLGCTSLLCYCFNSNARWGFFLKYGA